MTRDAPRELPSFDEIIGQPAALDLLRRLLGAERVAHALLFHGPGGVGKGTVARIVAAALLCEVPEAARRPCGHCAACRLVARGGHPDLQVVQREPVKDGSDELRALIVVRQIREVTRLAGLAPRQGRRRVFVVDPADRMNGEAQNALLKTLEEPPGSAVLILVASRPHLLAPTVRSRCFAVGFGTLRTPELQRLLEARGLPPAEAAARAALAAGRPGRALELDVDALRTRRDGVTAMIEQLVGGARGLSSLPAMAADLAGKNADTLVEGLELLQSLLRDASLCAVRGDAEGLVHQDLAPRLTRVGRALGAPRAARLVAGADRLRADLRINANPKLLAETMLAAVAGGPLP